MSDDRDAQASRETRASSVPRREALRALLGVGLATGLEGCARLPSAGPATPDVPEADPDMVTPRADPDMVTPRADTAGVPDPEATTPSDVAEHAHPAAGDRLVFAFGDREGQVITPADIPAGSRQVFAYPMDADASHVASESRLSQVMLVRLDPSELSEQTAANAADGIVAYSAVCTHTGCEISDWDEDTKRFQCPCHDSEFDPRDNGRVRGGPAPRRLAALPLSIVDGELQVAGGFSGRVGAQRR